jgi:hypothetical protein
MSEALAAPCLRSEVMHNVPQHLVVGLSAEEAEGLLMEWRWLVGEDKHVVLVSASGDLFLTDADGKVLWLETGAGRIAEVAGSVAAFEAALTDEANQREWLLAPVVEALRASGKPLGAGQCHGFCVPAVLGGGYDGDNRVAISVREHFGFTGHLHGRSFLKCPVLFEPGC